MMTTTISYDIVILTDPMVIVVWYYNDVNDNNSMLIMCMLYEKTAKTCGLTNHSIVS